MDLKEISEQLDQTRFQFSELELVVEEGCCNGELNMFIDAYLANVQHLHNLSLQYFYEHNESNL